MKNERLSEYTFIGKVPDDIQRISRLVKYQNGDVIFRKGETADYVYYILTGRVGIYNEMSNGKAERVVWSLPGEIVGEMEVMVNETIIEFSAYAYEDDTNVLKIEKDVFLKWLKTDRKLCLEVAYTLAKKLYISANTFVERSTNAASKLTRKFILDIVGGKIKKKPTVVLRYTRNEIAESCGISERSVNRCIKELKGQNYISVIKGKIMVNEAQYRALKEMND